MILVALNEHELGLVIEDAEIWARVNEDNAYKVPPGPKREGFMRQAMELQARANELRAIALGVAS